MPETDLTLEDVRRMAADIGLSPIADEHADQLLRASNAARARRAALRVEELDAIDEPAHVFRLTP